MTESQAMTYLMEHGFITPIVKSDSNHSAPPPGNTPPGVSSITEEVWEAYLVRLVNECPPSTAIAAQIKDFLDKKQAITAKGEQDKPSNFEALLDEEPETPA